MCCLCYSSFCREHAKIHFQEKSEHFVMMAYEIWQYEQCFWCFKCQAFCCNESFDNVLEPMFSSKGSFCPVPVTSKHSESFGFRGVRAGSSTAQGWRADNEDCHTVYLDLPHSHCDIFAVFDGHGGPLVSRYVGERLHKIFDATYQGPSGSALVTDERSISTALQRSFLACDEALHQESGEDCGTCGSTGCVTVLRHSTPRRLWCANTGDSRAVLCRAGKAIDISEDHRPALATEAQRIIAAGSSIISDRVDGMLAVSRAFGDFDFKQAKNLPPQKQAVTCLPDVVEVELGPGDTFMVIACDGIWDCLTSQEVVTFVSDSLSKRNDPLVAAEALIERCIAKDIPEDGIGTDNMSVVVVCF